MKDLVSIIGQTISNIGEDDVRHAIIECLMSGSPLADIVPEREKRVDTITEFLSAFLRTCYLHVENNI